MPKKKAAKPKKETKPNFGGRPPVVAVMGHIDHGKTTLLDAVRKSRVAQSESGGITQHIGAYQVAKDGRKITFIDTPGHAAFAAMRSRGAKATDLAILVIDAVESVKPQTKESLDHIKAAKIPFLVALNKMDLPNASAAVVKKDLADNGVLVEGYGGDVVCVEVSAKTGKGIDQLLEMVLLVSDMKKLSAKPKAKLKAVVIESQLDNRRGPVATVIVREGTLKVGDEIEASGIGGKVKALFNADGKLLKQVGPGDPAQILGLKEVPPVGSLVTPPQPETKSPAPVKTPAQPTAPAVEAESNKGEEPAQPKLKLIIKADVAGTLEAIVNNLGDEVELVSSGIGNITESDILLAQSTGAKILAFRVKVVPSAKRLAEIEKILIKSYSLIHELLDDVAQEVLKMLEPTIDETVLGEAKISAEFTVKGKKIAGVKVDSGKLTTGDQVHVLRGDQVIGDSRIKSLHQGKETVAKVKKGEEAGVGFSGDLAFQPKDKLVAYSN